MGWGFDVWGSGRDRDPEMRTGIGTGMGRDGDRDGDRDGIFLWNPGIPGLRQNLGIPGFQRFTFGKLREISRNFSHITRNFRHIFLKNFRQNRKN